MSLNLRSHREFIDTFGSHVATNSDRRKVHRGFSRKELKTFAGQHCIGGMTEAE